MNACPHTHDTVEAQIVCDTTRALQGRLNVGVIIAANSSVAGSPHLSDPAVSIIGNVTDVANMVGAILDMVELQRRPTTCATCQRNYDRLVAAAMVLKAREQGSC